MPIPDRSDGDDTLDGGDGNDQLYGGWYIDSPSAASNDDSLFGGGGEDYLYEESATMPLLAEPATTRLSKRR
jgi:Ca2+-binding RTX toxin-like protein